MTKESNTFRARCYQACTTLWGDAATARMAVAPGQSNKPSSTSEADHPKLDGNFAAVVACKLQPIKDKRKRREREIEGTFRDVCGADVDEPVMQGDGDNAEGAAIANPYATDDDDDSPELRDVQWHFRPTENPWAGKQPPAWNLPIFAEHVGDKATHPDSPMPGLKTLGDQARIESRKVGLPARVSAGLRTQSRHAAHLARQIDGSETDPWTPIPPAMFEHWDDLDPIACALVKAYGPNPIPGFLRSMREQGIEPNEPNKIGYYLRQFHVRGDPTGTEYGWAILHRCPGAGSFGSWRTGAVYRWHSRQERMEEAAAQFEDDYRRAMATRPRLAA